MNLTKKKDKEITAETHLDENKTSAELVTVDGGSLKKKQAKAKKEQKARENAEKAKAKKQKKAQKKPMTQQNFMLVVVVCLVVIVFAYVFIYLDFSERTEEVEASNRQLRTKLNELEAYYNNMPHYKEEIENYRAAISDIMKEYPADAREEDIIMLAVDLQEKNDITYENISMEETEAVYTIAQDRIVAAEIEGLDEAIRFNQKHASYNNITNYENLKDCIEDIYASPNRIGIDNIIYSKNDEDGTLSGSINLYFYSAAGTDKEYAPPDMAEYISGTSNLFGSGKVVVNDEDSEEEDGGEGEEGADDGGAEKDE